MNQIQPTQETLYTLFIKEQLPAEQIAEQLGISRTQVYRHLRRYGIERENTQGIPSQEVLFQLYVVENLDVKEIVKRIKVSKSQIYRGLRLYGIERRWVHNPKAPSRDALYQLYVVENLSAEDIAQMTGFTVGSIFYYLRQHGIERNRKDRNSRVPSYDTLYQMYVTEYLPVEVIAEKLGYSRSRIFHFLVAYGIERNKRTPFKTNVEPPMPREVPVRPHPGPIITYGTKGKRRGRMQYAIDQKWLYARYWDDNLNAPQIAEELGVNATLILRKLHEYNIPIKPREIAFRDKVKRFGDFSQGQRKQIIERDHGCCQMCGTTEGSLECHHIIPTRFHGQNSVDNGILLCNVCHDTVGFHELNWAEQLFALQGTKTGQSISV